MKRYTSEDPGAISEELLGELAGIMKGSLKDPGKFTTLPLIAQQAFQMVDLTSGTAMCLLIEHLAINVGWWIMEQQTGNGDAEARVAELEGLYAAAVKRLQDLGEAEVPLTSEAAEGASGGLRRGDVVKVVTALSTYHPVGSRAVVKHVSERGDFALATDDAATPSKGYGFAYRSHVKIVWRRRTG